MKTKSYALILCATLALGLAACGKTETESVTSATLSDEQRLKALKVVKSAEILELQQYGYDEETINTLLLYGDIDEALENTRLAWAGEGQYAPAVEETSEPAVQGYVITVESTPFGTIGFNLDGNKHVSMTESSGMEFQDQLQALVTVQDGYYVDENALSDVDISLCDSKFKPVLSICHDFIGQSALDGYHYDQIDYVIDVQGEDKAQQEALSRALYEMIYASYCKWNLFDGTPATAKVNGYIWDVKEMAQGNRNTYREVSAEEVKAQQDAIAEAERLAEEARIAEEKRLEEERLEQERKEAEAAEAAKQAAAAAKGKIVKTYNFAQSQYTPDPALGDITVNEYSSGYREAVFSYAGKEYVYEVLYEDYVESYYICVEYQVPGVWLIVFFFDGGDYCFSDGHI